MGCNHQLCYFSGDVLGTFFSGVFATSRHQPDSWGKLNHFPREDGTCARFLDGMNDWIVGFHDFPRFFFCVFFTRCFFPQYGGFLRINICFNMKAWTFGIRSPSIGCTKMVLFTVFYIDMLFSWANSTMINNGWQGQSGIRQIGDFRILEYHLDRLLPVCVCESNSVPKRSKLLFLDFQWCYRRGTQEAHRAVSNEALYGVFRISGLITLTYLHLWNCWQAVLIPCFPALGQRTLPHIPFSLY